MVRTIVFLFLAVLALGALATPFFAPLGVLMLLFLLFLTIGWVRLVVATRGRPSEVVLYTPRHSFLGPGGPDDPFADLPYADENPTYRGGRDE